jgi:bifunctional non-homologous end joining protein LigD
MAVWSDDPATVRPMLASTGEAPLDSPDLAYEPKYDGIRAIVAVDPPSPKDGVGEAGVRFWSRLGNEKTRQFPEIADALRDWGRRLDRPVILDGEIVALDERGDPVGFQNLQGRIHVASPRASEPSTVGVAPVALFAFDLLRDGAEDLRGLTLRDRRSRLAPLLNGVRDPRLRLSEQVSGGAGRALYARAKADGWEGLIAKRLDSVYRSGRRSPDWRKLKLVRHQTCVVGGWTDPRGSRPFFGALLLGVYDETGALEYVGHTGAGFSDAELGRVWRRLQALQTRTCPFRAVPRTNERPHWVRPMLVAEVKFTEWTADGKLRHPTYLGLRDDVKSERVRKEPDAMASTAAPPRKTRSRGQSPTPSGNERRASDPASVRALTPSALATVLRQLDEIEGGSGSGVLDLPGGGRLEISNLGKVFWPAQKLSKGDLLRHYVRVAPFILPALEDRPLVLKRYPNGVGGKPFYQHRAPDRLPAGVRVETVATDSERRRHLVGGALPTLLYTAQLAAISQDPWFSRVGSEALVDHVAIDLDPPEGLPFARVLDVARWVRDELDRLRAPAIPKTSGSSGLHVYIPMPPGTPYEAGLLFCQIVATIVAKKHPTLATTERAIAARGRRVYVDCLQNILGKTLASAYSARANDFAGVSTPLTWDEIDEGVSPQDFTVRTFAARIEAVGDLWATLRRSKGADLRSVAKYSSA